MVISYIYEKDNGELVCRLSLITSNHSKRLVTESGVEHIAEKRKLQRTSTTYTVH